MDEARVQMESTASTMPGVMGSTVNEAAPDVAELFERHHRALWRFAVRLAGDSEEASDAVQETFVSALRAKLPADPRSAEAWPMRT